MSDRSFHTDGRGGMQAKSGVGAGGAQRTKRGGAAGESAKIGKQGKRGRRLPESIRKSVEKMEAKYGEVFDWLATR